MKNNVILSGINLYQIKENFISYLDVSDLTLTTYRNGIESFLNFLSERNINHPTRSDFKAFREELRLTMKINSINSYMTACRAFFRYLEANHLYENITKDVKSLKTSKTPITQTLNQEQCKTIYNSLVDSKEKCLFSLAISTGLRANELANAKLENIKMYNGEIVLFVKCKKRDDESEYVKLSEHVLNDIKNYVGDRETGFIFTSTSNRNIGGGVTNKTIRLIIKNIFKRFGIDEDWFSCHVLRKSMATISYNNGGDIVSIQQVLHHLSIATTKRYISQATRDNNKLEYTVSNVLFS